MHTDMHTHTHTHTHGAQVSVRGCICVYACVHACLRARARCVVRGARARAYARVHIQQQNHIETQPHHREPRTSSTPPSIPQIQKYSVFLRILRLATTPSRPSVRSTAPGRGLETQSEGGQHKDGVARYANGMRVERLSGIIGRNIARIPKYTTGVLFLAAPWKHRCRGGPPVPFTGRAQVPGTDRNTGVTVLRQGRAYTWT